MLEYILFVAGLALLMVAGDLLVRGSVGIADRMSIPPLVIGLTVVAFGTSAPASRSHRRCKATIIA